MSTFIALALSALLLNSAFWFPAWLGWTVFIFLIPLFSSISFSSFSHPFLAGMTWGIIFFMGHFLALFVVVYEKAEGGAWCLIPLGLFILYCASHAAVWFGISAWMVHKRNVTVKIIGWNIGAIFYFYWIYHYLLWPCGYRVGYCFGSPLIPLAMHPQMLRLLGKIGHVPLLVCLIATQATFVLWQSTRHKRWGMIAILCTVPFVAGFFFKSNETIPPYLLELCYVPPPAKTFSHWRECVEEINMHITCAFRSKPSARYALMAESSFPYPLNILEEAVQIWRHNSLEYNQILCIGAYRKERKEEYNSFYKIEKGRITFFYDKTFLMPFTEYLPSIAKQNKKIRNLFLKKGEFSAQKNENTLMKLSDTLKIYPQLCSDIYMAPSNHRPPSEGKEPPFPILFAVNDSWFSLKYAQGLMFLYAIFYAIQHQKEVMYVGHSFGEWINGRTGERIAL